MKTSHSDRSSTRPAAAAAFEQLEQRTLMYAATVGVNTGNTFQTMDGFGAAMMNWTTPSEYTSAAFYDRIVNDLGATIGRTAIWPTFERANDNSDPNSFNWAGYDKNALGQAMTFMKRLQDRGMKNLLATVWTPPAWMKTNQSHLYGGTVRPDLRDEFAEYLAAVAIGAKRDFGVDLSHVSPQNEPFFTQTFESATYTNVQMREVIRSVMHKFDAEGLGTKLVIPEEMAKLGRYRWYADAIKNDPEVKNFAGVFGTHSAQNPAWADVGNAVAGSGHNLWSVESHGHAQTIQGALVMAQDMYNALTLANASAYVYWQWSEDAGEASHSLMIDGQPAIKYHVAKHFYRYVRPGAIRIGASSSDARLRTISFKDPSNGAVTHILFNPNDSNANATINLSGSGLPSSYKAYRTSGTENHVKLANVTGGSQISITLPPQSIVTLYSGPDLAPVTATSGGSLPAKQSYSDGAITNALRIAAANGDAGDVRELLANGADPNASAFGGYTALHAAAMSPLSSGAVDVIHALRDAGANVSAKTTEGFTPLHIAAMNTWTRGETQTGTLAADRIRALIARGASVTAVDNKGRTPLHWGAMMTKLSHIIDMTQDRVVVDALLDGGSAVNAKDSANFTPLDYAVREGNTAGATELKNRGGVHGAGAPGGGSDTTPPTADVIDVSPDPRDTAVSSIDVTFSEPVTGVDLGDFILMRDGGTLALSGASLSQVNSTTWRISNLASLTGTAGAYMLKLEKTGSNIVDNAGLALATSASDSWTFGSVGSTPQSPFHGSPFAFGAGGGATIQAEDYDLGGEGVAFHETTASNIGNVYRNEAVDVKLIANTTNQYRISDAAVGEWIEYSIVANDTATYELELRLSNADPNAKIHVEIDGVNVTGPITVPDTNNFSVFQSVKKQLNIAAGAHVLRVAFDVAAVTGSVAGIDWMKINPLAVQPPQTVTIVSPIVSYVRDGSFANTNFGVEPEMLVKRSNTVGNSREGYVLFDLAGVTTISNAVLRLRGRLSDATEPSVQVNVLSAPNTTWTEGGLTWNNKPPAGPTAHGAAVITGTTAQNYDVNLTSFLQGELAAGRTKVTIVLKAPSTSNPWAIFDTDSTPNGPRLVITP